MEIEKSTYQMVLVRWIDSMGCSSTWCSMDIIGKNSELPICHTLGWLVVNEPNLIVVVPHFVMKSTDHMQAQGCGDMTIPRVSILNIVEIQEGGEIFKQTVVALDTKGDGG